MGNGSCFDFKYDGLECDDIEEDEQDVFTMVFLVGVGKDLP
jgi:hypothetical protein